MKRLIILFVLMVICGCFIRAQVPQGFSYQAVARDASGNEIASTGLKVRVAILASLTPEIILWEEEHSVTTNQFGLFTLTVGDPAATRIGGLMTGFGDIDWLAGSRYILPRIYYQSSWYSMTASRLMSVPYARIAGKAQALDGNPLMMNGDTVFFLNSVAIGTDTPGKALLAVVGEDPLSPDALFEVRRQDGEVIFAVYNEGVRINIPVNPQLKGPKGGFAIGGFDPAKGVVQDYFLLNNDSTRLYVKNPVAGKGPKGGFAIGGFDAVKTTTESFLNLNKNNYFIGYHSGHNITTGINNAFIGSESGFSNTSGSDNILIGSRSGYSNSGGYSNIFIGTGAGEISSATHTTFIGYHAGYNLIGDDNIAIGDRTGSNDYTATNETYGQVILGIDAGRNVEGSYNTVLGYGAGSSWSGTSTGSSNVFVGSGAGGGGYTARLGSGNVCIGYDAGNGKTGNNKLYIANNSTTPLIYGEFDNKMVQIEGNLVVTGTITAEGGYAKSGTIKSELTGLIDKQNEIIQQDKREIEMLRSEISALRERLSLLEEALLK